MVRWAFIKQQKITFFRSVNQQRSGKLVLCIGIRADAKTFISGTDQRILLLAPFMP